MVFRQRLRFVDHRFRADGKVADWTPGMIAYEGPWRFAFHPQLALYLLIQEVRPGWLNNHSCRMVRLS